MRNSYSSTPFPGSFAPYAVSEAPWGDSQRKPVLYRLVRAVTIVAVLSGVVVGLHRNDLLREGARRLGHEAKYLELERRLIGVPGYGTPRSVEANLHAPPAAPATAIAAAPGPELAAPPTTPKPPAEAAQTAPPVAPEAAPQAVAAAPAPEPTPVAKLEPPPAAPAAPEPVDPLKPISLDQLPVLRSGQASAKALAPTEPSTPAAAAPRTSAKVQVFDLDGDSPKAKKAKAKPEKVEQAEKAAAPKPAPKAKAKEPDPTAPRAGDNPLKAAIRDAMRKQGK
jgi:hypothetical protein